MDEHLAERLSAAVDGELSAKERRQVVDALCQDPTLRSRWMRYHCLGDVMRKDASCVGDRSLAARVREELDRENVLTPHAGWWTGRTRRYWMPLGGAVAASMAALVLTGMPTLGSKEDGASVAVISQAPADADSAPESPASAPISSTLTARVSAPAPPAASGGEQAATPHLNRYLIDHSRYSGARVQGIPSAVRIAAHPEP